MPVQKVDAAARLEDTEYQVSELECVNDRYNTANQMTLNLYTDVSVTDIADVVDVEIDINGQLVFTGEITELRSTGPYSIEMVAHNAVKGLKNNRINELNLDASAIEFLELVLDQTGYEYIIHLPERQDDADDDVQLEERPVERAGGGPENPDGQAHDSEENDDEVTITIQDSNQSGAAILDEAAEQLNAIWYVNAQNTIVFTSEPNPVVHRLGNEPAPSRGVLDASAGKREPPYQSVYVSGTSPTDNDQFERSHYHIIATNGIQASAGNGTPVYTIHTDNVNTAGEAQTVANSVYNELQRQQQGGWVACIGMPEVRIFDVIQMPDHLGGEQYLVSGFEHLITAREGFVTTIQCGGLI